MNLFGETNRSFKIPNKVGYSFDFVPEFNAYKIKTPTGNIFFAENFFNKKISDRSISYFLENDSYDWKTTNWVNFKHNQISNVQFKNINWRQDKIKMYGKDIFLPRYSSWYGDTGKTYNYSGINLEPNSWNKGLLYIKNKIEPVANAKFNSVLMNWYRDGNDYINWHADNEKELGENPIIGSVNFGVTRRFLLRNSKDHSIKLEFPLCHGSLLIMSGALQHYWEHSIPKQKKIRGNRINLTFRKIR